jgi:hypothetical protein
MQDELMPGATKPASVSRYIEETLGKKYRDIQKTNKGQSGMNNNRVPERIR